MYLIRSLPVYIPVNETYHLPFSISKKKKSSFFNFDINFRVYFMSRFNDHNVSQSHLIKRNSYRYFLPGGN